MAVWKGSLFAVSLLVCWILKINVQSFPLSRSITFRRYAGMEDLSTKAVSLPWYVMEFKGDDALKFLQGLTTGDFLSSRPQKLFVADVLSSKGKAIDHSTFLIQDSRTVLMFGEFSAKDQLLRYFDSFIFPLDKVKVRDVSDDLSVVLSESAADTALSFSADAVSKHHHPFISPIPSDVPISSSKWRQWDTLIRRNNIISLVPMNLNSDTQAPKLAHRILYELCRVYTCRPAFPYEIQADPATNDPSHSKSRTFTKLSPRFSPFELGTASHTVALQKGCYTGQEIIAKGLKSLSFPLSLDKIPSGGESLRAKGSALRQLLVSTYQTYTSDVKIKPPSLLLLPPGTVLVDEADEDVGIVTSCAAFIMHQLLSVNFKDAILNNSSIQSIDRDFLADQVMSALRADVSIASHPLSQLLLTVKQMDRKEGEESLLDSLLTRVVIILRSKALPADCKDIKAFRVKMDNNREDSLGFARDVVLVLEGADLYSNSRGEQLLAAYPDYTFKRLLLQQNSDTAKSSSVTLQQNSTEAVQSPIGTKKDPVMEEKRIADKLAKRKLEIAALLAARQRMQ